MSDQVDPKTEVVIHYIKSPQCVDLPVNGAFGGINKQTGTVFMAVFAERPPIPQEVHLTPVEGEAGKFQERRIGKKGVIRSVNAVLHFDINSALAIREWLTNQIEEFMKEHPDVAEKIDVEKLQTATKREVVNQGSTYIPTIFEVKKKDG